MRERGRNIERERERERERKRERPLKGPSGTRTLIIFAISEKGKTDHFALDSAEWHANFHHFEVVAISKKRKKRQTILPLTATSGTPTLSILKYMLYRTSSLTACRLGAAIQVCVVGEGGGGRFLSSFWDRFWAE